MQKTPNFANLRSAIFPFHEKARKILPMEGIHLASGQPEQCSGEEMR